MATSPNSRSFKPHRRSLNKENDRDSSTRSVDWDWRKEEETEQPKERSHGIAPKAFHNVTTTSSSPANSRRRLRPGQDEVQLMHIQVQSSILNQKKQSLLNRNEVQRSAFKQVTSLRTWPLQNRALRHYGELMDVHMHLPKEEDDSDISDSKKSASKIDESFTERKDSGHTQTDSSCSSAGESSAASSSGKSSGSSLDHEPKRVPRYSYTSPAQSRLKVQFREQFLAERALSRPLPVNDHTNTMFGSPLWSMEPRVFSLEKSNTGKRSYVVGHLGRFLDRYWRKTDPSHRYYYELILEKTPCRLYLDLEFSKESNDIAQEEAESFLEELLEEISFELTNEFGLDTVARSDVVDLDSSTETKFSRHWIFHLPGGALFPHTAAMGYFMQEFVSRLANEQATGQLVDKRPMLSKYLFVNVSPSHCVADKRECLIDLGVYTRNRLFRVLGSSKFGKPPSAALRIAETNQFPFPPGFSNASFHLPAMKARLRTSQPDTPRTEEDSDDSDNLDAVVQQFMAATDWTAHAHALAETLVIPVNASKIEFPILPFDESCLDRSTTVKGSGGAKASGGRIKKTSSSSFSYGESAYPLIDRFVVGTLASRGGLQGSIRAWSVDRGTDGVPLRITYQISGNRWCECIGRSHKSNNILWNVDLQVWHCVQSCYDPDCRAMRFQGTPVSLPEDVREAVEDAIFEEQLVRLDESEFEKAFATLNIDESKQGLSTTSVSTESEAPKCVPVTQKEAPGMVDKKEALPSQIVPVTQQEDHPSMAKEKALQLDSDTDSDDDIEFGELARQYFAKRSGDATASNKKVAEREGPKEELSDDALLDAVLSNPELFP